MPEQNISSAYVYLCCRHFGVRVEKDYVWRIVNAGLSRWHDMKCAPTVRRLNVDVVKRQQAVNEIGCRAYCEQQ